MNIDGDHLNPDELAAAQAQVNQYGERATQIVNALIRACLEKDHYRGGQLCQEMHREPNLLLLVVGMLTSHVVKGINGPLATPEQLGMDPNALDHSEPWEVGVMDQISAAAENRDVNVFAALSVDALLRSYKSDVADAEDMPDAETMMRGFMVMDRMTVIAIAAELLRRLTIQEVGGGG